MLSSLNLEDLELFDYSQSINQGNNKMLDQLISLHLIHENGSEK